MDVRFTCSFSEHLYYFYGIKDNYLVENRRFSVVKTIDLMSAPID